MNGFRYKKGGWYGESHRHSLAARGYSTTYLKKKLALPKIKPTVKSKSEEPLWKSIPIDVDDLEPGRIYPVSPDDVRKVLKREKLEYIKGIKGIEFSKPQGEQKDAWGQYVRSRRVIKIFSQPFEDGLIDGQDPKEIYNHIIDYVIPHEIGHHRALEIEGITDKNIYMAEARADGHVIGLDPTDPGISRLIQ